MSIISQESAVEWAKLFSEQASLLVGSHDGDEYYYTDENYDEWNNNNQPDEYNSDQMAAQMEAFFLYSMMGFLYLGLMALGFFVFPPFIICLAITGGALNTCSFNIWNGASQDNTDQYQY